MLRGGSHDHFQHTVAIAQHIGIPEAENSITLRFQPLITLSITRVLRVLSAVDLNDQAHVVANKVDDEATDWCLASEAQAVQSMSSQC